MARKFKGFKGRGNGYHDSAVFKSDKRIDNFMARVQDAMENDRQRALANNMILIVNNHIEETNRNFIQACIFCPTAFIDGELTPISLVKVKENHFKCPRCNFVKIKKGVEIDG